MQAVDYYSLPTLIYLMCVMSSMSFVVSVNVFLFRVLQGQETDITHLGRIAFFGQMFSFLAVVLFSLCVGLYDYGVNGVPLRVGGEVLILVFVFIIVGWRAYRKGDMFSVSTDVQAFVYFLCMCFAGWAMTIGIGISFFRLLTFLHIHFGLQISPFIWSVFISGLLWNAPTLIIYRMIRVRYNDDSALQNVRFHKVLWPVLAAYLVLLCPLIIENHVNSPERQGKQNFRPVRSI